jgi:hypothetical protein
VDEANVHGQGTSTTQTLSAQLDDLGRHDVEANVAACLRSDVTRTVNYLVDFAAAPIYGQPSGSVSREETKWLGFGIW